MRLLTSVFVFLFTLCAFVGTVYAQDEAQMFEIILVRSYVPVCKVGCKCIVDTDNIIEYSSCAFRTYVLALVPQGLDQDTIEEITTSMVDPTTRLIQTAAQEVGADAEGCVEAFVDITRNEEPFVVGLMDSPLTKPLKMISPAEVQVLWTPPQFSKEVLRLFTPGGSAQ